MSLKFYVFILTGTLSMAALPDQAAAQDNNPAYAGFAIGFSGSDESCDYYGYNCDGSDTSFRIYGGKRLHENLAIEASYQNLGKLRNERASYTTIAESEGINLSLLGIIPVSDLDFFYGKAGYMLSDTEYTRVENGTTVTSDESSDFTYGMGFAFLFSDRYDFRLEFERLNELGDEYVVGGSWITVFSVGGTIYLE